MGKDSFKQNDENAEMVRLSGMNIVYCIIGIGFFCLAWFLSTTAYVPLKEADLTKISGRVTKPLSVFTDSKHRQSISFNLNSWPHGDFILIGDGFNAGRPRRLTEQVRQGDSLFISVNRKDYEKALAVKDTLKSTDSRLLIYTLRDKKMVYLDVANYNAIASEEIMYTSKVFPWILILVGLFLCRSAIKLLWNKIGRSLNE